MQRMIINAVAQQQLKDTQLEVSIGKDAKLNELEFVLIKTMYFLVTQYAKDNHLTFNQAAQRYSQAVNAQLGVMYDLENKHANQHNNS
jgi:hypothetical protein